MDEYNQIKKREDNMALASLIMGIIGIVTSCCCFGGVIFGTLGIVFAVLSRNEGRFEGNSMAGFVTSIVAVVLTVLAGIFYFGICLLDS